MNLYSIFRSDGVVIKGVCVTALGRSCMFACANSGKMRVGDGQKNQVLRF